MKTRRLLRVFSVAVLGAGFFFTSTSPVPAQFRPWRGHPAWTNSPLFDPVVANFAGLPGALAVLTNVLDSPSPAPGVTVQNFSRPRAGGTYWSLQGLTNRSAGPMPFSPFGTNVPVYALGSNQFVYDDRTVDYAALAAALHAEAVSNGWPEPGATFYSPGFDSQTALWLSLPPGGLDDTNLSVLVHNTSPGLAYTLLTKEDLTAPAWQEEQLLYGAAGDVTPAQLERNARTNLFVWARTGTPTGLFLLSQPLSQDVYEYDTVSFSVVATGNGTLTYQWMCDGTNIPGATASSYAIDCVLATNAANYAVMVSDGSHSVASQSAQLLVEPGIPDRWFMIVQGRRQNYTFKDGITYFISEPVQLFGTTTIKAGNVIKFDGFTESSLVVHGSLVCETDPYYPAILTSVDDDSVGEQLTYSSPQTTANGLAYLNLDDATGAAIKNLRIRYADLGISTPARTGQLDVWDCQFVACNYGVVSVVPGAVDRLHNVLFSGCGAAVGAVSNAIVIEGEQVTADVYSFCLSGTPPSRIALTNSILLGQFAGGSLVATQGVAINPDGTNFQAANAGLYYLAANSPLHHAGTTNISPALLNELPRKTTYPPVSLPLLLTLSGELTLAPQVPRYTTGAPDIGYHYEALDYTVARLLSLGGRITVQPDTVIGFREDYVPSVHHWSWWGFDLHENSTFVSHGTPARPITYADAQFVQEQFAYPCYGAFRPDFWPTTETALAPRLDFRFCNFYAPRAYFHFWSGYDWFSRRQATLASVMDWSLADCTLHGGRITVGQPATHRRPRLKSKKNGFRPCGWNPSRILVGAPPPAYGLGGVGVGVGVGGVAGWPPPESTMMRARFQASMKRLPASVPANCKTRSSRPASCSSRLAVSVSTSLSSVLRFTICPRGLFITLVNAVIAALRAAMRAGVTPRPAAPVSLCAAVARSRMAVVLSTRS